MGNICDLVGKRFGYLSVLDFSHTYKGHSYWLCICECGGHTIVRGSHLKSGNVTSCGCRKGHITHGESGTRLYAIWNSMRKRCRDPKNREYHRYGGRGITVCAEWLCDFQSFYDWAIANGYNETAPRGQCTLDRIDNDGNYEPSNCRWATAKEQANNTRRTRFIELDGERHSVTEWSRRLGINQSTISMRINKYGWSAEKALRTEVRV